MFDMQLTFFVNTTLFEDFYFRTLLKLYSLHLGMTTYYMVKLWYFSNSNASRINMYNMVKHIVRLLVNCT